MSWSVLEIAKVVSLKVGRDVSEPLHEEANIIGLEISKKADVARAAVSQKYRFY